MYNQSQNKRKDTENMSFVAMLHNQNGIVAIADSKSTVHYTNGDREEEVGRKTQKLFCNSQFILLTFGKNQIELSNGNYINLEDIINDNLKEGDNPSEFLNRLLLCIKGLQKNEKPYEFHFLIGYQKNIDNYDRFVSQSIDITTDGMTSSPYQIKTGIFAGGCHSQIVNGLNIGINWTIDELVLKARTLMEVSRKLEEAFSLYSAVGNDIHIVSLDSHGKMKRYINEKKIENNINREQENL